MKKNLTLVMFALIGAVTGMAQVVQTAPDERTDNMGPRIRPTQHVINKSGTAIWGAEATVGTVEGQFQNAFVNSTSGFMATSWTALTVSESGGVTPGNAYWTHTMTGLSQGAYAGGTVPIGSPTQANGAALFDSDFMDNGGTAGAFGTGSSPAPHAGMLVSPIIDLTGYTDSNIVVRFFCNWREFSVSEFSVGFSTDNGNTWVESSIASALPSGGSQVEGWVSASFSNAVQGVANLTQCRIRFNFDGDYYFALIDDVTIEAGNAVDLTIAPNDPLGIITDQMYYVQLTDNRHIPVSGLSYPDAFRYGVVVQNQGGETSFNNGTVVSELHTFIDRDMGGWTNVHADTTNIPSVVPGTGTTVVDTLSDASWATVGDYRIVYVVNHFQDQTASNDTLIQYFTINDDTYASKVNRDGNGLPVIETAVAPAGTFTTIEFGSTFDFPNIGSNNVQVDSLSQGFYVPSAYNGPADISFSARIYEWDDVNGNEEIDGSSELTLVALGLDTVTGVNSLIGTYLMRSVELIDVNTSTSGYVLEDNKIYYAATNLSSSIPFTYQEVMSMGCISSLNYGMNIIHGDALPHVLRVVDDQGAEVMYNLGYGVTRIPSLGLHLSPSCLPVAADMSFTENFLAVNFTDMSTSQGDPANSWSWDFGDGNTSTMQNPTHTYAAPGQYEVCLTVWNSCSSDTLCDSVEVIQDTSNLPENWADAILVYPNPAEDIIRIQNIPQGIVAIELRNVVGQVVYASSVDNASNAEVPVSQLASGHYNLMLRNDTNVAVKHVIVK